MNYQKIYDSIIDNAKSENRKRGETYYENHHIIPRCLNGNNNKENLVLLTAKEHFVCHKLLTFIYPDNRAINYSLFCMALMNSKNHKRITLSVREYTYIKNMHSINISGEGNGMYGKTVEDVWLEKYGEEELKNRKKIRRIKISKRTSGSNNPNYGKTTSEEIKEKQRIKAIGRTVSQETRKIMARAQKRRFQNKEEVDKVKKQTADKGNPMYGKCSYSIWIEKYGIEEANKRKEQTNEKRRESWRKKKIK